MNELQFQRELLTNPLKLNKDMLAYLEKNPEKKIMAKNAQCFDQQIEQALDVEVPEGLEARILLSQSYPADAEEVKASEDTNGLSDLGSIGLSNTSSSVVPMSKSNFPLWGLSAVAASLLVVSFSLTLWLGPVGVEEIGGNDVVAHILDHVEEDPELMTAFKVPDSQQDLQKLFLAVGASLNEPIDQMSYAGECVLKGQKGLHVVIQDRQGPVTIIVLPGQQLDSMVAFEASGYQGELVPVKGGVVAIVGNNLDHLAHAHMRFFKAVKFA